MADDTLVVICAVMKPGEGRHMLDALRWAHIVSQKGITPQNIHLFVNVRFFSFIVHFNY